MNHRSRSPVLGYALAGILVFLSASSSLAEPADRLEQNKALVLESIAALDAGDLDNLDKFIADDYVRHCQATVPSIYSIHTEYDAPRGQKRR